MRERLDALGLSYARLAQLTDDDVKQVERWLGPKDRKIPADFVARFCLATNTNGHWLLTGDGSEEPVGSDAYARGVEEGSEPLLRAIRQVKDVRDRAGLHWPPEQYPPLGPDERNKDGG